MWYVRGHNLLHTTSIHCRLNVCPARVELAHIWHRIVSLESASRVSGFNISGIILKVSQCDQALLGVVGNGSSLDKYWANVYDVGQHLPSNDITIAVFWPYLHVSDGWTKKASHCDNGRGLKWRSPPGAPPPPPTIEAGVLRGWRGAGPWFALRWGYHPQHVIPHTTLSSI